MSRLEWLLGGALALIIIVIAGLLVMWWRAPAPEQQIAPPHRIDSAHHTALAAFQIAEPVARQWSQDAVLLAANASWPAGMWQTGTGNWTLTFYSASKRATGLIRVSRNEAQLINVNNTTRQYRPAATNAWQIDSPTVVEQIAAVVTENDYGQSRAASLLLSLHTDQRLQWEAVMRNEAGGGFQIMVDATTGQVVTIHRIPERSSEQ